MSKLFYARKIPLVLGFCLLGFPHLLSAQAGNAPQATVSFSPHNGTFQEGATFEIPIFLNTLGNSIDTISLHIVFDPTKLAVVQPAGNKSIITLWTKPPSYSNTTGNLFLEGMINGGLTTESGLVSTITFKALALGETKITIAPDSKIYANDGLKSLVQADFATGLYTILSKPQEGVRAFSPTHPFPEQWYNNSLPVFSWEKPPGTNAFSFSLDNQPLTIPDNNPETADTTTSFSDVGEGLSYFHVKARKNNIWGGTTHFLVKIDTTPPVQFSPGVETLASAIVAGRAIVDFSTTDSLSGIDHYEVGVIDKKNSPDISPVFVEVQSPYQLPVDVSENVLVIVRAYDKAGNNRDATVDVTVFPSIVNFVQTNLLLVILGSLLFIITGAIIMHYLFGHGIFTAFLEALKLAKERAEKKEPNPYL